jgi:hypothetical protein
MMARYGAQFGPDLTFLGVPRCDWEDPATFADADVVVLGAPFDGGMGTPELRWNCRAAKPHAEGS